MAAAKFRHANSPDEIAKREAREAAGVTETVKGFRHYNHPEEVAKRERPAVPVAPTEQQRGAAPALPPVLPTPAPLPAGVVPSAASVVIPGPPREPNALIRLATLELIVTDLVERLEDRVDGALTDLFGTPEELQALRLVMHNLPALEEQGLSLRNRVKALEDTLDAHFEASTTEIQVDETDTSLEAAPGSDGEQKG